MKELSSQVRFLTKTTCLNIFVVTEVDCEGSHPEAQTAMTKEIVQRFRLREQLPSSIEALAPANAANSAKLGQHSQDVGGEDLFRSPCDST